MIEGMKELEKKLDSMPAEVERGLIKGLQRGTHIVQAAAKLGCPKNDGELWQSIRIGIRWVDGKPQGAVYTNKPHAVYVEMGTGPIGAANHKGISPEVSPVYRSNSWWIHESQISKKTAEKYHMFSIETKNGIFYRSSGQPAQPFMYPAAKASEEEVTRVIGEEVGARVRKAVE